MDVREVSLDASPLNSGDVRLQAWVRYDDRAIPPEAYWFDVPAAHAAQIATSGNPWFACLLPLAAQLGEPLRVRLPVDRALLTNARQVMRIWKTWYPALHVVDVEADVPNAPPDVRPTRAAAFFSGGVDSFFTALRDRRSAAPAERRPVDDLVTVWGFDVPLTRPTAFARMRDRYASVAAQLGKEFVSVATNLRTTRWRQAQWSRLAHGAGLTSVGLALERRYHTVYIAGSGSYRDMHPWGSHYVTDPLFSTTDTSIVFDGAAYLRTHKIEQIATSPLAMQHLRVCFESESDHNCGTCDKCRRTMIALDLCGALGRCGTLPNDALDPAAIARIDCSQAFMWRELEDLRVLAEAANRPEIVNAITRAMSATARRVRVRRGLNALLGPARALARRVRGDA